MCTVTVVPVADGLRLACNRDELRSRSAALPPDHVWCGDRQAIFPMDPDQKGTWVAVSDAGLAFAVLNANRGRGAELGGAGKRSRGKIIPALLSCSSFDDAVLQAMTLPPAEFHPFRLLVADGRELLEIVSCGEFLSPARRPVGGQPMCFTSSGLGDELVEGPRRDLFRRFFAQPSDFRAARQDEFHRHSWPDLPHLSVCMSRLEAATVSYTTIELRALEVRLTYHAGSPDRPAPRTTLAMSRLSRAT